MRNRPASPHPLRRLCGAAALAGLALPGCDDGGSRGVPVASIGSADVPGGSDSSSDVTRTADASSGSSGGGLSASPTPDQIARARRVVTDAAARIAETHADPNRRGEFEAAVSRLLEARLTLALAGDAASVDALYAEAAALFERDRASKAAADAAYARLRFARANAERLESEEWAAEFARQARLFAAAFPADARAAEPLAGAAFRCDDAGLAEAAAGCYALLLDRFPGSPEAATAVGCLRRLKLVGGPVQLAGPTLDGRFVSIDDSAFRGKAVMVLLWKPDAPALSDLLAEIAAVRHEHGDRLRILGVVLGGDAVVVRRVLRDFPICDATIDFADPAGSRNPIAAHYGVRSAASLWLVGPDGTVHSTTLTRGTVAAAVKTVLTGRVGP